MSTRSRIAVANSDGTYTSIYCHFDGHPSGVGRTLFEHWNSEGAARELLSLGDISALDSTLDGTVAYARDRGETDVDAAVSLNLAELKYATRQCGGEYLYVFDKQWHVAAGGIGMFGFPARAAPGELVPLATHPELKA